MVLFAHAEGRCPEICDVMLHHVLSFPTAVCWKEQESRRTVYSCLLIVNLI